MKWSFIICTHDPNNEKIDTSIASILDLNIKDFEIIVVGGEHKKNSSSWILKEWSQPATERLWGKYTVLDKGEGWATKKPECRGSKPPLTNTIFFIFTSDNI